MFQYQYNPLISSELQFPERINNIKNLPELLAELRASNTENTELLALIDRLEHDVIAINDAYLHPSRLILPNPFDETITNLTAMPIKDWTEDEIMAWSIRVRQQRITDATLPEVLAVIKQAVKCSEKFLPRDIQILSVLSLLYKGEAHGRLAQIYTGEGKTTTIAIVAVVKVLQGRKVDIVTSSEVLAGRDAKEKESFYKLFGISAAENCSDLRVGQKPCYRADIVYGDTLSFQGDILCDEYRQYDTRCKRPFDVVIVDEVDNMLIDERLRMTRLSTNVPGMSALTPALEFVWYLVRNIHHNLTHDEGSKFDSIDPAVLVKLHLKEEMKRVKAFVESSIPLYLKEYAANQIVNWCFNAAHALLSYKENEHYVIRDNQIVPVDYRSTGTFQHRMHWGEGLHQFLQIKHDLPVDQINLTTNFLSNVTFFQRYGANIIGLTGTLGSLSEQALLKNLYTLDSMHIPSYKLRRLQEEPGIMLRARRPWLEAIKASILEKTSNGRAVLVVCETIQKVRAIQATLRDYDQSLVRLYIENTQEEQQLIHEQLQPRQIIIATNLAGRGTDLKISEELEENGGLHVIVAYLPENIRVQDQAFGRAGRQGSPGTAQLIININDESTKFSYSRYQDINEVKIARDTREKKSLDLAARETQKVVNKDKLFTEFCRLMKRIKSETRNNKEILDALEERWGLWLLALTDEHLLTDTHKELFAKFKTEIEADHMEGGIIKNPKYYLRHGHIHFTAGRYEEALQLYQTASRMNQFDWYPVYYRALTIIKLQEKSEDFSQLAAAAELLEEATKLCGDDVAKYEGIRQHYQKLQLTLKGKESASVGVSEHVVRQHYPSLQRTVMIRDEASQQQIDQGLQQIDNTDISTNCSRYNNPIEVRLHVLQEVNNLRVEALQALEAGTVFKIDIIPIDSTYTSKESRPVAASLKADGFTNVARKAAKEIPLAPVIFTGILGIIELAAGIVLCATGIGAIWGYGLIIEGAGDLLTAAITALTKEFDWKLYVGTKSVSMILMLGGCGFLNAAPRLAAATAPAVIMAGRAALGLAAATPVARAAITHFMSKEEVEERVTKIITDGGLKGKIDDIQKLMEEFASDNPAYIKEFREFEQLCTEALKVAITKIPKDILDYVLLLLNSEEVVKGAYKKVNENYLDALLGLIIQHVDSTSIRGISGAGQNAFVLLDQHKAVDSIIDKLIEELRAPNLDFYTPDKIINMIVHTILNKEQRKLESALKKAKEDKDRLASKKGDLEQRKSLEKDAAKVKDIKADLSDVREEIDEKENQIVELGRQIDEFNARVRAIQGVSSETITPAIEFLKGKVFKADTIFEILATDAQAAQTFFEAIPLHPSLEVLRSVYIHAFMHIYDASSKKENSLSQCSSVIEEMSRSGDGSLIPSFWVKYLSKIAAVNGLEIRKTVELAKVKIAATEQEQREEVSAYESGILGIKNSVPADGDCYFTSVAVALGLPPRMNIVLRQMTIDHIISDRARYERDQLIIHSSFDEYIQIYSARGTWMETRDGNDIMVPALAEKLGLHIVIHDEMHGGIAQSVNGEQEGSPIIHLSYTGAHYTPYVAPNLTHLKSVRDIVVNYVSPNTGSSIRMSSVPSTLHAASRESLSTNIDELESKSSLDA